VDAISEIFYYTISTNVNCHQLCRWWQFCFQQNSTLAHDACNTVKRQRSELSTSLLLIVAFNLTAQQWSPLVMRFRDSHINVSIKCKSARLKKSSSGWLKSHEVGYSIRVKMWSLCFFSVLQRCAETLFRWDMEKYSVTAWSLVNDCAKNYKHRTVVARVKTNILA